MSRAVMQQALEALEERYVGALRDRAIEALEAALAEPEQEPVAWRLYKDGELYALKFEAEDRGPHYRWEPLYTAPTPQKPQTTHWEGCEAVHPECRKPEPEPVLRYDGLHEYASQHGLDYNDLCRVVRAAITALRAALAEPEQEPVTNASSWFSLVMNAAAELEDASNCLRDEDAKRVAVCGAKYYRDAANALYTAPTPRRPLTDEEIEVTEQRVWSQTVDKGKTQGEYAMKFSRAIERAHKIGVDE